jgi:hypothetical protein
MSRQSEALLARQRERLTAILQDHPEGLGPGAIAILYAERHGPIPPRVVRQRLGELTAEGRLQSEGATRARIYRLVEESDPGVKSSGPPMDPSPADAIAASSTASPGLLPSAEGAEVQALVRRPVSERPVVGYDPGLLEAYRPGETWYVPDDVRAELHRIGRTPAQNRPAGTYARDIFENLLIDLSWSSSRLEGNRYTRLDTEELLRFGNEAPGTDERERQMILNHKAAIEMIVEGAEEVDLDRPTILGLHGLLSENLVGGRHNEGRLRTAIVRITDSPFVPLAIPQKLEELFDLMLRTARAIPDPFEQAFFMMVHLPYLQPFYDVNKRTSRLAANIPLIKANLCPLSFVDVPETGYVEGIMGVYELGRVDLLRDVFVWAYERSCARYAVVRAALGEPDPIRLRYREELRAVVREMVEAREMPDAAALRAWGERNAVLPEDADAFVQNARADLLDLHPGILHRYRLRPSQFDAWDAAARGGRRDGR